MTKKTILTYTHLYTFTILILLINCFSSCRVNGWRMDECMIANKEQIYNITATNKKKKNLRTLVFKEKNTST